MMRCLSQRGVWWRQLGLLLTIVKKRASKESPLIYVYCHEVVLSGRRRCCLSLCVKCVCVCICFLNACASYMCVPEQQMEVGESSNNKLWVVYQTIKIECSHLIISSLSLSLPSLLPFFNSCSSCCDVTIVTAGSSQIGCVHLFPLNYGFATEIANQPLRSTREEEEIEWIYFD